MMPVPDASVFHSTQSARTSRQAPARRIADRFLGRCAVYRGVDSSYERRIPSQRVEKKEFAGFFHGNRR
jgi:hypothetical protein